jgi:prolyl oligopeptidase
MSLPIALRAILPALLIAGACAADAPDTPASAASSAASTASADDPYLWLEQLDSPEAMAWVRAENRKTLDALESDPRFAGFHEQALAIAQARDRIPMPSQLDGRVFNFWQDADHVRGIWRATTPADYDAHPAPAWKTVLDLDRLAAAEHANWVWEGARCDARRENRCLLLLSDGGEDAVTVREFDLRRSAFVPGGFALPKGKLAVTWESADSVLAAREWTPGELTASGYPFVVRRVRRGQPLAAAREIFRGQASDVAVELQTLTDAAGRQAVLVNRGVTFFESENWLVGPHGPSKLGLPPKCEVLDLFDGQLIVKVKQDWNAAGVPVPQGALVAIDLAQARREPQALRPAVVFAPTPRQTVESVASTRDALVVSYLDNVRGRTTLYARGRAGAWHAQALPLPDNADVHVVDADARESVAYLSVAGYLQPSSLWRADTARAGAARIRALPPQFDASRDVVEQHEATSADGARIPYFIVHPKDMAPDGDRPTLLYAYGGFEVSLSPAYSPVTGKLWLERGGVFVVANIRGGGEFGPAWHEAALKTRRQVAFDDFAAVARDLIARRITRPRRLGIEGGSNGGLLMGVEMTQHPELWNAVDIQVPLLDMLRFEQIAAGASWAGEYGSVSVPQERAFLAGISPYAQLRRGVAYPRALVWTTTKDDRVGPQHARKFAARLAEYGIPYYYYEVVEGGHGAGANLQERAHTSALEYVYFTRQLMD